MIIRYIILFVFLVMCQQSYSMQKNNDNSDSTHMRSYHGAGLFRAAVGLSTRLINRAYNYVEYYQDSADTNVNSVNSQESSRMPDNIENSVSVPQSEIEKSYLGLLPPTVLRNYVFPFFRNRELDNIFINIKDIRNTTDNYRREGIILFLFFPRHIRDEVLRRLEPYDVKILKFVCRDFYGIFKNEKLVFKQSLFHEMFLDYKDVCNPRKYVVHFLKNIIGKNIKCYHGFYKKTESLSFPIFVFFSNKLCHEGPIYKCISSLNDLKKLKVSTCYELDFVPEIDYFLKVIDISKNLPALKEVNFRFLFILEKNKFGFIESYLDSFKGKNTLVTLTIHDKLIFFNNLEFLSLINRACEDLFLHKFVSIKKLRLSIYGYNSDFFNILSFAAINGHFKDIVSIKFNLDNFSKAVNVKERDVFIGLDVFFKAISLGKLKKLKTLELNLQAHELTNLSDLTILSLGDALMNGGLCNLENLSITQYPMRSWDAEEIYFDKVKMSYLFNLLCPKLISAILDKKVLSLKMKSIFIILQAEDKICHIVSVFGEVANEKIKTRMYNLNVMINEGKLSLSEFKSLKGKVFEGFLEFISVLEYIVKNQKDFNEHVCKIILQELDKLRYRLKDTENLDFDILPILKAIHSKEEIKL